MRKISSVCLAILAFMSMHEAAEAASRRYKEVHRAPTSKEIREWRENMMWDLGEKVVNKAAGYIPSPSGAIAGQVWSCGFFAPLNLIFSAIRTSIQEDRELGHGEAMGIVLNNCLNPIGAPLAPFFNQMGVDMWKNKDLCGNRNYRNYPGLYSANNEQPERDIVPLAARHSWYEQRYCGAPRDRRYDVFLKDAGMKARTLDRATGASRKSVVVLRAGGATPSDFAAPRIDIRRFWPDMDE